MTPKGERRARSLLEDLRRPDAGEPLPDRVRAEFESVTELDAGEHLRVDTTVSPEAAVRAVRGPFGSEFARQSAIRAPCYSFWP
jgi:hypothetical protein